MRKTFIMAARVHVVVNQNLVVQWKRLNSVHVRPVFH